MQTTLIKSDPIFATKIEAQDEGLLVEVNEDRYLFRWEDCSEKLANATYIQRMAIDVAPSGYGIHWPLLDEDLSVGGLIRQLKSII